MEGVDKLVTYSQENESFSAYNFIPYLCIDGK